MVKVVMQIEGMHCGMCEAHVNDAVRRSADVKKVSSSCRKGTASFLAADEGAAEAVRVAVEALGYRVLGVQTETYEKRGGLFR